MTVESGLDIANSKWNSVTFSPFILLGHRSIWTVVQIVTRSYAGIYGQCGVYYGLILLLLACPFQVMGLPRGRLAETMGKICGGTFSL